MAANPRMMPDWFESRSFSLSLMLHLALVLLAAFGLPAILPDRAEPVPLVMTVEVLPIGEITNVKPSDKPITPKQKAPTKVVKKDPVPAKMEKKVAPVQQPKEIEEEDLFDPDAEKKPVEKTPPKETPKPDAKDATDFDAIMKDLQKQADAEKNAKDTTTTEENTTKSDAAYDDSLPLSLSEQDAIRTQFIPCWSPPVGAKDAQNLIVILKAQYKEDGSLIDVKLRPDQQSRYTGDGFFKAAADSAIRAVHRCSPLKNLSMDKYGSWRDMELTFDPSIMAGY